MMSLLPCAMRIRNAVWAISAFGLLSTASTIAQAETSVAGEPAALRVVAQDATLQEVLAALRASFGLQFKFSIDLNRSVSGTYNGSLREVVTRLLDGHDFFLHKAGDDLEVVILGFSASTALAPTPAVGATTPKPLIRRDF